MNELSAHDDTSIFLLTRNFLVSTGIGNSLSPPTKLDVNASAHVFASISTGVPAPGPTSVFANVTQEVNALILLLMSALLLLAGRPISITKPGLPPVLLRRWPPVFIVSALFPCRPFDGHMVASQCCASYALRNLAHMVNSQSAASAVADANGTQGGMASTAVNALDTGFVLAGSGRLVTPDL